MDWCVILYCACLSAHESSCTARSLLHHQRRRRRSKIAGADLLRARGRKHRLPSTAHLDNPCGSYV